MKFEIIKSELATNGSPQEYRVTVEFTMRVDDEDEARVVMMDRLTKFAKERRKFIVGVSEVSVQEYAVTASSKEEAKALVADFSNRAEGTVVTQGKLELSHELPKSEWLVTESE